jgi:hypothetical protein
MKPEHTLLSLPLTPRPENLHCYLVSNDKSAVQAAGDRMLAEAERRGIDVALPVILATPLTGEYIKRVQRAFSRVSAEVADCIATMKDQHLSIVGTAAGCPFDKDLMELH